MLYQKVSFTHFRRIWRQDPDLSKIHCRKWMRFMKCDLCTKLRSSLTTSVVDGVRYHAERIRRLYLQHIRHVKAERGCYWARRRFACEFPGVKLSITIDGSDQINNGCPWYFTKTHAMEGRWNWNMLYQNCVLLVEACMCPLICLFFIGCYKFRLHVYGVLVHGRAPFVYLVQDHVEQGHHWSFHNKHLQFWIILLCSRVKYHNWVFAADFDTLAANAHPNSLPFGSSAWQHYQAE